jgi:hypothetical protein
LAKGTVTFIQVHKTLVKVAGARSFEEFRVEVFLILGKLYGAYSVHPSDS